MECQEYCDTCDGLGLKPAHDRKVNLKRPELAKQVDGPLFFVLEAVVAVVCAACRGSGLKQYLSKKVG